RPPRAPLGAGPPPPRPTGHAVRARPRPGVVDHRAARRGVARVAAATAGRGRRAHVTLHDRLVAHGVPEDEIARADRDGTLLELAVDRILVGQPRYTSEDIARQADMDIEILRRLWRALTLTDTADRIFTDADLEAASC